jgi:hypothetical protein
MIVLHGIWRPPEASGDRGDFFLWGESSFISPVKRRGRPPNSAASHPYQALEKDLKIAIESFDSVQGVNISKKARSNKLPLLLPSLSRSPLASPDMLRDDIGEIAEGPLCLSQWKVDGLCIPPEDAVMLLSSLSGAWTENDSAVIGTDLRFWSKVSKFAMELLSKQHFVPGIVFSKNNMAFARWQYALNDEDARTRFSKLSRSMPPVCRALVQNSVPNTQEAFLSDYLNNSIDSCIRSWMPISEIRSKKPGLSEAWLKSLATGEPIT